MAKARFKTKLSKKQKRKNILVFLAVIVCLYAFTLLFCFGIGISKDWMEWMDLSNPETHLFLLAMVFSAASMTLVPVMITAIVLGIQRGKARRVREDTSFIPVQHIDYYRDNLNKLNPSLVSLLIDLDLYGRKDIVATLLRLQNKKAIRFDGNGHITVTAKDMKELDGSEFELLCLIQSGKLNDKKALSQWKQNRFREAELLGYIQKKDAGDKVKIFGKHAGIALLSTAAAFVLWGVFLNSDIYKISSLLGAIQAFANLLAIDLFLFVPWYLLLRQVSYSGRFDILWERTPLGNETAEKIAGLARFIHEFSLLSQAKQEQVALWEDYLVYAIVLEENEQVMDEISKRYKINLHKLQISNDIWHAAAENTKEAFLIR